MTTEPSVERESPAYKAALERAEMLQGYYIHLLVYLVVNSGLFVINLLSRGDGGTWWFYWPLAGWGVGLAVHTLVVTTGVFGVGWKDRKAEELYRRGQGTSLG